MKKVENRICLIGFIFVGNGIILNWFVIFGIILLVSAVIVV